MSLVIKFPLVKKVILITIFLPLCQVTLFFLNSKMNPSMRQMTFWATWIPFLLHHPSAGYIWVKRIQAKTILILLMRVTTVRMLTMQTSMMKMLTPTQPSFLLLKMSLQQCLSELNNRISQMTKVSLINVEELIWVSTWPTQLTNAIIQVTKVAFFQDKSLLKTLNVIMFIIITITIIITTTCLMMRVKANQI